MSNLVGIVSDTHEDVRMIRKAIRLFQERKPTLILHCGDIISPPVLEHFTGLPVRFVFGNNDGERFGLKQKCLELGFGQIDDSLSFEFAGKSFFVNHGTSSAVIDEAVKAQIYDMSSTDTPIVNEMKRVAEPGLSIQARSSRRPSCPWPF